MKRMLAAALLVAGVSACGGPNRPQQFVLAVTQQTVTAGPGECPAVPDPKVTTVPFITDSTVTVYQGDPNTWFLDTGGMVLQGTLANGTYTFTGATSDDRVNSLNNKDWEQVSHSNVTVTMKVDGNNVTASVTQEDNVACTSFTTDACKLSERPQYQGYNSQSGNTIDCIYSYSLTGVKLEDPQFKKSTSTPGTAPSSGAPF